MQDKPYPLSYGNTKILYRQTDRQTDRQTHTHIHTHVQIQTHKQIHTQTHACIEENKGQGKKSETDLN